MTEENRSWRTTRRQGVSQEEHFSLPVRTEKRQEKNHPGSSGQEPLLGIDFQETALFCPDQQQNSQHNTR